jgi:hypothetical protein
MHRFASVALKAKLCCINQAFKTASIHLLHRKTPIQRARFPNQPAVPLRMWRAADYLRFQSAGRIATAEVDPYNIQNARGVSRSSPDRDAGVSAGGLRTGTEDA